MSSSELESWAARKETKREAELWNFDKTEKVKTHGARIEYEKSEGQGSKGEHEIGDRRTRN